MLNKTKIYLYKKNIFTYKTILLLRNYQIYHDEDKREYGEWSDLYFNVQATHKDIEKLIKKYHLISFNTKNITSHGIILKELNNLIVSDSIANTSWRSNLINFINTIKKEFQDTCDSNSDIYINQEIGINDFSILWMHNDSSNVNFIHHDN